MKADLPVVLPDGRRLRVRRLERGDSAAWTSLWRENRSTLTRWMTTSQERDHQSRDAYTFAGLRRRLVNQERSGSGLLMVIEVEGRLVGQVALADVVWGARCSGSVGYWVDRAERGRGIATRATATFMDLVFASWRLHRLELDIMPSNFGSLRVAHHLGLRSEGVAQRLLSVNGSWQDHEVFAITREEWAARHLLDRLEAPPDGAAQGLITVTLRPVPGHSHHESHQ